MICQLFFRNLLVPGTRKLRPWLCYAVVLWPFMAAPGATSTTCDHLGGSALMARDDARAYGRATGLNSGKGEWKRPEVSYSYREKFAKLRSTAGVSIWGFFKYTFWQITLPSSLEAGGCLPSSLLWSSSAALWGTQSILWHGWSLPGSGMRDGRQNGKIMKDS